MHPTTSSISAAISAQATLQAPRRFGAPVPQPSEHDQLVKQTGKWVSMSFFGPMLKQMRDDPFRSKLFDGGRGGEMFGSMYDQELAERMTRGVSNKLVNSIVRKLEAKRAYAKQAGKRFDSPMTASAAASISKDISNVAPRQ